MAGSGSTSLSLIEDFILVIPDEGLIVAVAESKVSVLVITATHGIDLLDDAVWDGIFLKFASLDDAFSAEVENFVSSLHPWVQDKLLQFHEAAGCW